MQDTFALTAYFRGRVGDPKRIILWGSSLGGLVAVRLMEDHPRSFDGAIATSVRLGRPAEEIRSRSSVSVWPMRWCSDGRRMPGAPWRTRGPA